MVYPAPEIPYYTILIVAQGLVHARQGCCKIHQKTQRVA
jgi:hypothetical protein